MKKEKIRKENGKRNGTDLQFYSTDVSDVTPFLFTPTKD
jgi:hypothetical protein